MNVLCALILSVLCFASFGHAGLPADYQSWKAEHKQAYLWNEILRTEYRSLPEPKNPGFSDFMDILNKRFLDKSFSLETDEIPVERIKLIHTYGSVAAVEFVAIPNSPYSGILRSGAQGLARLSVAQDPRPPGSFTPGVAVKFLIDQKPSRNIFVMEKLEGQGLNQNFFENILSNELPAPTTAKTKLLVWSFSRVKKSAGHLTVSHLSSIDNRGNEVKGIDVRWPRQLLFKPAGQIRIQKNSPNDFRQNLSAIPVDTVLYEVWTKDAKGSLPELIGHLVTRSRFVASEYGDKNLFFQHERFEEK